MDSTGFVTLEAFAARVGCHFTTASRLRNGERMPSRELLGRIVEEYHLDSEEVLKLFTTGTSGEFGDYLKEHVFKIDSDEADSETGAVHDNSHAAA